MTIQAELKKQAYDSTLKSRALSVLIYLIDRSNKELTCFPIDCKTKFRPWWNLLFHLTEVYKQGIDYCIWLLFLIRLYSSNVIC